MGDHPYLDVVDFVERTTYSIWNAANPDQVLDFYGPASVIWSDGGDTVGGIAVTESTRRRQAEFTGYRGVIADTIWTGDDESGYRTSMRWTSRGTSVGDPLLGIEAGRGVVNSCIANCVVLGDQYVEEWGASDSLHFLSQLGLPPAAAVLEWQPSAMPVGAAAQEATRNRGVSVPAVPDELGPAAQTVVDALHRLFTERDLAAADTLYAPGAPYTYGASRWNVGPDGARAEVSRLLDALPDLTLAVEELYWNDDADGRSRVAVRTRITGTGQGRDGVDREVGLTTIHHVHVRGPVITAEWIEYDDLALLAQLR